MDKIYPAEVQHSQLSYAAELERLRALNAELLGALEDCLMVLHPGAVGLIMSVHGNNKGQIAVRAVLQAKELIAKATK